MIPFADRLVHEIREKAAPVCVGLDPLIDRIPEAIRAAHGITDDAPPTAIAEALHAFCADLIDVVAPLVPALKINIAFFERYREAGVQAYYRLVRRARDAGLVVIGDVKRADIGHSTTQYALAQLADFEPPDDGMASPDAVTVNPYFGFDGIRPFVEIAREQGKGIFVLVQTSNESAAEVQNVEIAGGGTVSQHVGGLVQQWSDEEELVGSSGYSAIGAVVSPRDLPSTERLRERMSRCIFLVPGFGAQGRTANEVARCFKQDGTGAIVNASRSVIYAFQGDNYADAGDDWRKRVEAACVQFVSAVRGVVVSA